MADRKITQLDVTTSLDDDDRLVVVDTSDTSMAASGTNKQISKASLIATVAGTTAGTLATGEAAATAQSIATGAQTDAAQALADAAAAQAAAENAASSATLAAGVSGRYSPNAAYYASQAMDLVASQLLTLYYVWSCPIFIPRAMTIDRIAIDVTTAGDSSTVRLGLYEYDDDRTAVTDLIVDGGTVDTSSTGVKEATVSAAVDAGPLLAVAVWQSGSTPSLRCQRGGFGPSSNATQAINTPAGYGLNTVALPTGALPATLNVAPSSTSFAPRIAVRGTPS